jgi:hypothetical protein
MGINLDNYEQYFLEHLEGNLSREQEQELEAFLLAHPNLRPMLDDLENAPILCADEVVYHPKQRLKKTVHHTEHIHEHNAEEWMISSLEGLLNAEEQNELWEFLRLNPAFDRDMKMYHKTILPAEEHPVYPGKNKLKKKAPVIPITRAGWISTAVAVVLLLFFGIRYFIQPDEVPASSTTEQTAAVPGNTGQEDVITVVSEGPVEGTKSQPVAESSMAVTPLPERRLAEGSGQLDARVGPFRMRAGGPGVVQATGTNQMAFITVPRLSTAAIAANAKEASVISRVAGGILADAGQAIVENTRVKELRRPRMNFWSVISSGIRGYNTITDRDIELLVKRDDEGKITSYALLEQDRLIMSRYLDKN